jgi:hypothetical protein
MKSGAALGPIGRYAKVQPAFRQTLGVAFMTRLAVGARWVSLSPSERHGEHRYCKGEAA